MSNTEFNRTLKDLVNKGIATIYYEPRMPFYSPLIFTLIFMYGPPKSICSSTRSFLKYTPTSQASIENGCKSSLILSRIPSRNLSNLATRFIEEANNTDVAARFLIPSRYTSYTNDLYKRLLTKDLTWDEDVSEFVQ